MEGWVVLRALLQLEGTIKPKLFPFFCAIILCMFAFHPDICQLRVHSWLAKLQVSFSPASQSKEKGQRGTGFVRLPLYLEGKPSVGFPLGLIDRTGFPVYL